MGSAKKICPVILIDSIYPKMGSAKNEYMSCNPYRFYPKIGSAKKTCPVILIDSTLKEVQRISVL
jgi:hypothetical protein